MKFTKNILGSLFNTDDGDFEEYDDLYEAEQPEPKKFDSFKKGKVVNINATTQFQVVVIQPESFDESKEIADNLKARKPVVINLELMEKEQARKMFDFLNGAIYALGGSVQKISTNIYLIAPYNVTILGDFKNELKNNGLLWEA